MKITFSFGGREQLTNHPNEVIPSLDWSRNATNFKFPPNPETNTPIYRYSYRKILSRTYLSPFFSCPSFVPILCGPYLASTKVVAFPSLSLPPYCDATRVIMQIPSTSEQGNAQLHVSSIRCICIFTLIFSFFSFFTSMKYLRDLTGRWFGIEMNYIFAPEFQYRFDRCIDKINDRSFPSNFRFSIINYTN